MVKLLNFSVVKFQVIENVFGFFLFTVDVGFEFRGEVEEGDFALNEVEDLHEEWTEGQRGFDQDVKVLINYSRGFLFLRKPDFRADD